MTKIVEVIVVVVVEEVVVVVIVVVVVLLVVDVVINEVVLVVVVMVVAVVYIYVCKNRVNLFNYTTVTLLQNCVLLYSCFYRTGFYFFARTELPILLMISMVQTFFKNLSSFI